MQGGGRREARGERLGRARRDRNMRRHHAREVLHHTLEARGALELDLQAHVPCTTMSSPSARPHVSLPRHATELQQHRACMQHRRHAHVRKQCRSRG